MKNYLRYFLFLFLLIFFTRCSNDGGTSVIESDKNHPPEINQISVQPDNAPGKSIVQFTCIANDYDGDDLTYEWKTERDEIIGHGLTLTWRVPNKLHYYDITCTVEDGKGGSAEDTVKLSVTEISPNEAPVINALYAVNPNLDIGDTTSIICNAVDYDQNIKRYYFSLSRDGEIHYNYNDNYALVKFESPGEALISCFVTDTEMLFTKAEMKLNINAGSVASEIPIPSRYPSIDNITIADTIKINEDVIFECIATDANQSSSSLVYYYGVSGDINVSIKKPQNATYRQFQVRAGEPGEFYVIFEILNSGFNVSQKFKKIVAVL